MKPKREIMKPKTVQESQVNMICETLPSDANPTGKYVHGGAIMKHIDSAAGIVAKRHCRPDNAVTAIVDKIEFLSPVFVGKDVIIVKASLNYVGRTSMEIGVRVEAENLETGKVTHTNSSYVTMVALDKKDRPTPVPRLIRETEEEERRYQEGKERVLKRKQERKSKTGK